MGFINKLFNHNDNSKTAEDRDSLAMASKGVDNGQPQDVHADVDSPNTSNSVKACDYLDPRCPLSLLPFDWRIGIVRGSAAKGDDEAKALLAYYGLEEDHTVNELWGELSEAKDDESFQKVLERIYNCTKIGHPESLFIMGVCFYEGLGVQKDQDRGWQMLQESCEGGCTSAMNQIGLLWRRLGNHDEALPYFQRAADMGDMCALHNLGNCYFYSWGVERDDKKANELWRQSAAMGNPDSYYTLGNSYYTGTQVEQNIPEAIRCYTYAATHPCNVQWDAVDKLVKVYRMIGDEQKSREWQEKLQLYQKNNGQ
ncbi:MAG: sel1 repeat family protein [Prevotella sp.]|nr:sel1 repeat family protein [Prevotella sp.]